MGGKKPKKSSIHKSYKNPIVHKIEREERIHELIKDGQNAMRSNDWRRLLTKAREIIALEGDKGRPLGYKFAFTACRRLGDISGMERYLQMAIRRGINVVELASEFLELYYRTKRYSELEELYEKVIDNPKLSLQAHMTMIQYYGDKRDFSCAEEVYNTAIQQPDAKEPELRSQINKIYIKHALGKMQDTKELYKFINKLKDSVDLTAKEFKGYLDTLYARSDLYLLIDEYTTAARKYQTDEVTLVYLNALRKLARYEEAIKKADELAGRLPDNDPSKNHALAIKGFCLMNFGKREAAKEVFQNLLLNIGIGEPNYVWIICGYIFTEPKLNLQEKQRFKQILTTKVELNIEKGLKKDIENALRILETL